MTLFISVTVRPVNHWRAGVVAFVVESLVFFGSVAVVVVEAPSPSSLEDFPVVFVMFVASTILIVLQLLLTLLFQKFVQVLFMQSCGNCKKAPKNQPAV